LALRGGSVTMGWDLEHPRGFCVLKILAQTVEAAKTVPASQPTTAPAPPVPPYDFFGVWIEPMGYGDYIRAMVAFGVALLLGLLLLVLFRRWVVRFKLTNAMIVGLCTTACFVGVYAYAYRYPLWSPKSSDPVVYWIDRVAAALMTFVLLRFVDRLVLVPILTRGGRVPLTRFVHQISNIVLAIFAVLIFGSKAFEWDITTFLAGSAVVSIVLGLALQETLGNFFSGLVMQASPPFQVGDWIVIDKHEGRVVDMTWRAVTLHTDDDNFVSLPNATVSKAEITNYHAPSIATARNVDIGLEYDLPPLDAIEVLSRAAAETEGVQSNPPPEVQLKNFADSAVVYEVKFWITNPAKHEDVENAFRLNAWYRLKEKGYGIPYPMRTVEHVNLERKSAKSQLAAIERRAKVFDAVPLLAPLSGEQKRRLAASANDVALAPGQVLFRQDDSGDSFYIIWKGSVDVMRSIEGGGEKKLATLGVGDFFGEMSALTGQPRTATIRAATPFWGVQIEKADLMELFHADPSIMEKMSEVVAKRNAEREALIQGAMAAPVAEAAVTQQRSILARMKRFFRIGVGVN
jgi:small-conductance mechanosensitive channel/CRP-like cAMP-binding protein